MVLGPRGGHRDRPSLSPLPPVQPLVRPSLAGPPRRESTGPGGGGGGGVHVPDPPHPLRPEFASRGQMGNPTGKRRTTVPLSKPWSAPPPPREPVDAPCPTPRGQAGQLRERLKIRGSLAVCSFVVVGGWVHPTCHPYLHQSHMEEEQSDTHLPFPAPPRLA